jgi:two-component system response regulator HydG
MLSPQELGYSLDSPLRLRLVAELLSRHALSLDDAVRVSGRHRQDVAACLRPMVRWGVLSEPEPEQFELAADLPDELLEALRAGVAKRADQLGRERHVRERVLRGMIGVDPKMQLVFESIRQVCRLDVPVLITGETGTGKELVARAIHDLGPRRAAMFDAVNCATLPSALFESQMFGHARGAFTGAVKDQLGLVESCHGGTLFLDEIGDLQADNQVKLLRVLQEGTFRRVGETTERRSDFRLIAATHRDLEAMLPTGAFREDLFYRINVVPIRLPSLRERLDDLPHLVEDLLAENAARLGLSGTPTVTPAALEVLRRHPWPGNVRELENVVVRAAIAAQGPRIDVAHLPKLEAAAATLPQPAAEGPVATLEEVERRHIAGVVRLKAGNIRAAAAALGITRATLYRKMKRYAIEAP